MQILAPKRKRLHQPGLSKKAKALYTGLTLFCLSIAVVPVKAQTATPVDGIKPRQLDNRYPLIPYPQSLTPASGNFLFNKDTRLIADSKTLSVEIRDLRDLLQLPLKETGKAPANNYIALALDPTFDHAEGYQLDITPNSVHITAKDKAGIFRAIQTIRQLLPVTIESNRRPQALPIPAANILDFPTYAYRGMHLDVSRHFFSMDYLKKFVDRLALYKFNKFHLHLTDDEGWRVEIKKYPKLTSEGAWRTLDAHDSACIKRARETGDPDMYLDSSHLKLIHGKMMYGGFYTQKELKNLVAYAAARHIDIIPEIDMPGHSRTAIRLYPFLACSAGHETGKGFSVPMCPCNEATYTFAENVYKEIFDIFPYEYVHLGADEVNKESWQNSAECALTLKKEGLKGVNQLQSYFVRRMEKFFNRHGKKLIGWDEILEGGVTPTANVMYWRSWVPNAPIIAARQGNKVIMTPGNPLYFDATPDKNSLMNVYHFNPIPKGLNQQQAANILGAQANSWTEYIPTTNRLEYMEYPRMLALSEVLWTAKTDDSSFMHRLNNQFKRMDKMNIHYRLPDIEGILQNNAFLDSAILDVQPPKEDLTIHYTVNGQTPALSDPVLDHPLVIKENMTIKLAAFTQKGHKGDTYSCRYQKTTLSQAVMVKRNYTGLNVSYYAGQFKSVKDFNKATPTNKWNQPDLAVDDAKATAGAFGLRYTGLITIPESGIYTFYLTADDGAVLTIDHKTVIDNDGLHSAIEKNGQIALEKGHHFFQLDFIEGGGGYKLNLDYSGRGATTPTAVTPEMLK
ncbi:family 20 glycosylhydrolase [Arachidicoccus terrestris]|uniref:family 20 glycosylhydrolase n=1 Tax=Arachidicoccus terrestris TaxID=2875539 RepID=UPI001CC48273|nr:family 20 glycosylhydrolase [Arachidicoccus terrestris]UAY54940.1 family 20 glycosylhydrolase [Arachidicoccus terrestris]